MGGRIEIPGVPGGVELRSTEPSEDAKAIIINLVNALQQISNQLDLQIRIMCGVPGSKREDIRKRIMAFDQEMERRKQEEEK